MQAHQTLAAPYGTTIKRDRPLLLKLTGDFGQYNDHSFQLFFQYYGSGQGPMTWPATKLLWLEETPMNGSQTPKEGYLSFDLSDTKSYPGGLYELVRVTGGGRASETEGQELVLERSEGVFLSFTLEGDIIQPPELTLRYRLESIS